jgi:hypothetical protein
VNLFSFSDGRRVSVLKTGAEEAAPCCASRHFVVLCSSSRRFGGDAAVVGVVWGFEIGGSSSCFDFEVSFQ